jgi:hypothetical protein
MSDDALGDAIGAAVIESITDAHIDAIFRSEPRRDSHGNNLCPVCDAERYRRATDERLHPGRESGMVG